MPSAAAMEALGARLAIHCPPAAHLYLKGDLGAGKTTLVRGFLHAHGWTGRIKSPTYTLLESYELPGGPVFHFDLYRLADPAELEALGYRDYFGGAGICVVEWPERGGARLGRPDVEVELAIRGTARVARFSAPSEAGREWLERGLGGDAE